MAETDERNGRIDRLSTHSFDRLVKQRLGPSYGASVGPDGERRLWRDHGMRRSFATGRTWCEALWRAWRAWRWPIKGA